MKIVIADYVKKTKCDWIQIYQTKNSIEFLDKNNKFIHAVPIKKDTQIIYDGINLPPHIRNVIFYVDNNIKGTLSIFRIKNKIGVVIQYKDNVELTHCDINILYFDYINIISILDSKIGRVNSNRECRMIEISDTVINVIAVKRLNCLYFEPYSKTHKVNELHGSFVNEISGYSKDMKILSDFVLSNNGKPITNINPLNFSDKARDYIFSQVI